MVTAHIALLLQPKPRGIGVTDTLARGVDCAVMLAALRAKAARSERIRKDDDETVGHKLIRPFRVQLRLGVRSLGQPAAVMQGDDRRKRARTVRAIECRM